MFARLLDAAIIQTVRVVAIGLNPRLARANWNYNDKKSLPNPADPYTVEDKWMWRKLIDHSPVFIEISDKLGVRGWLERHGISVKTSEVIWAGSDAREIPDAALEGGVVVKANHGSAMNIFLPAPPEDRDAMTTKANSFLTRTHGERAVEWAYSAIERKIFVERFLPNATSEIKLYCFGGRVARIVAIFDRLGETTADVWVPDVGDTFKRSSVNAVVGEGRADRPLPACTDAAIEIAKEIGVHFDHIRVDFMSDDMSLWLGELTVYNLSGNFHGVQADEKEALNRAWDIRKSWFLTTPQTGWRKIYAAALLRRINARSV